MRRAPQPLPPPRPAILGRGGCRCTARARLLTCRGAGPSDPGEKRGGGKQQKQAPVLCVPPARSGRGRKGEAGGRGRGAGARGSGSYLGAIPQFRGPPWAPGSRAPQTATDFARGPLVLPPGTKAALGRGSSSGSGGQDPSTARVLSHPRSETRLRRTQRSRARRAPPRAEPRPTSGSTAAAHSSPGTPGNYRLPTPLSPSTDARPQPQLPPGRPWVTKKSPAPALVWVSGQLPPAL